MDEQVKMPEGMGQPIIEIKPGRYFSAIWYIEGRDKNWMAALWRDEPDGAFTLSGRFRYYVDDKRHDSDDRKSVFGAVAQPHMTEAKMLSDIDSLADGLVRAGFGRAVEKLILRTNDPMKVMEALQREKWSAIKTIPAPEKSTP